MVSMSQEQEHCYLLDMVALCLFKDLAFQPVTHSSVNKGRNPSKIKKEEMRFANNHNKNQSTAKYWERVAVFGFGPCMHWVARTQPACGALEESGEGESASHSCFTSLLRELLLLIPAITVAAFS